MKTLTDADWWAETEECGSCGSAICHGGPCTDDSAGNCTLCEEPSPVARRWIDGTIYHCSDTGFFCDLDADGNCPNCGAP